MKLITEFIIEKLKLNKSTHVPSQDLEDLEVLIDNWFFHNCNLEDYDSEEERQQDLKNLVNGVGPIVDGCFETIDPDNKFTDQQNEFVLDYLAKLAEDELNK